MKIKFKKKEGNIEMFNVHKLSNNINIQKLNILLESRKIFISRDKINMMIVLLISSINLRESFLKNLFLI